jgi:hypothetical protein
MRALTDGCSTLSLLLLYSLVTAAGRAAPPNLTSYSLPAPAVCINGCPAEVSAVLRDPSLWVITLGGLSAPGVRA